MFTNFVKVAIRNLLKYKVYSLINIVGLAVGIASFVLIVSFVMYEFSFDKHHENHGQIVRVNMDLSFGGQTGEMAVVPAPLAAAMVSDYSQVKAAARFRQQGSFLVKVTGKTQNFKEQDVVFADPEVLQVFTIPILEGPQNKLLKEPGKAVISQRVADKYFGNKSAVGQTLILDDEDPYLVEAVYQNMPENSHLQFDILLSMSSLPEGAETSWLNSNFATYLLLEPQASIAELEARLPEMVLKYVGPQIQEVTGRTLSELESGGSYLHYRLQPLTDIHLGSGVDIEFRVGGDYTVVVMFLVIALAILLIACINFMNLATARSVHRSREVGVRKVLGSRQGQLVWQFLAESILLSSIATVLALVLAELLMPAFRSLADRPIEINYLDNPLMIPAIAFLAIIVGVIAGSYPALFLSSFKPAGVLKGTSSGQARSGRLRSTLVVLQFSASIILLISTIVVQGQLSFIRSKKLGYQKDQVLVVQDAYALGNSLQTFKQQVIGHPDIVSGSVSGFLPVWSSRSSSSFWPGDGRMEEDAVLMQIWSVDEDYLSTFRMELVAGRNFDAERLADSSALVINESALKQFGWTEAVGKKIYRPGFQDSPGETYTVIGVIRDFHFNSLKENISALSMRLRPNRGNVSFRLTSGNYEEIIAFIRDKWITFGPGQPFAYNFLDERFDNMYRSEETLRSLFGAFATIAILIASLGLLALTAFTTEQRTKEIGVRKVLGATMVSIVTLLSKEFIKWVVIANLIAWPVAALLMRQWLSDFVYHMDLSWWIFAAAGLGSLFITAITVSAQAIRAALANPIEALRYE